METSGIGRNLDFRPNVSNQGSVDFRPSIRILEGFADAGFRISI